MVLAKKGGASVGAQESNLVVDRVSRLKIEKKK